MIHQLGLVLLILLLVCNFGSCQLQTLNDTVTSSSNSTTVDDIDKVEREKARAKMLYNKAMAVRQEASASQEELKISVHQLYAAAGVVHLSMNYTSPAGHMMDGETFYTSDDVDITWRNGSIHHVEAVRELIYAFRSGRGAPFNPAIAHKLVKELAKIGNQEFQADLATMYSLGLEPVAPNQSNLLFILKKPNMDLAMLHYYFAAKGDDPVAKMALGFRFLHGLGVEKSCETAALYYEPVASTVISAATINGGLPSISKKRFVGVNKEARAIPTAEHEFLHYQWFADYGHADAARAVAHLLTHGPEQDLVSALDYLMQAADMGDADAMAHIGHAYANGIAVSQNNATAKAWFLKAAEKGHPSGILGLGVMHLTGQGTPVDHGLAARYLTSAADASKDWFGKSDAQFYAGTVMCLFNLIIARKKIPHVHSSCCARVVKGTDLN
jgi:SEL1 protein